MASDLQHEAVTTADPCELDAMRQARQLLAIAVGLVIGFVVVITLLALANPVAWRSAPRNTDTTLVGR